MEEKWSPEISPIATELSGLGLGPTISRPNEGSMPIRDQVESSKDPNAKISSVKPVVDDHDRLWSEINVLDDASQMAEQACKERSFFGEAHAKTLDELRNAQIKLAQVMAETKDIHDTSEYRTLWENDDIENLRRNLFDQRHFENMEEHVQETLDKLEEVSKLMKRVDEQSREFWQSSE